MPGTDSQVIKGLYDITNIQDRLRKYAQDKDFFRFWVLRQRTPLSLLKIISEKFGTVPSDAAKAEWKFRYPEFDELDYQFYLSEASNSTNASNTKFKVTNSMGAILNSAHRLTIDGIWTRAEVSSGNPYFGTAINIANGIVLPEVARVIDVGTEDSGGAGFRIVTVRRGHPADSYSTANPSTAPAVTTSMLITISNLAVRADSYPATPVTKNSKYNENVIQITRWSYGLSEMMTQGGGIDTFLATGTEAHLNISYQIAEAFMTKLIERAMITGRKSEKEVGGSLEHETGGLLEWILPDTDHIIDLQGQVPSIQRMNSIIRHMADVAGISEVWMFTGTHAAEALANQYDGKTIYYTDGQLSLHYQMKIMVLEGVGRNIIVYHVVAPIMNELGMAREALVLNLTEYNYNQKQKYGCFQIAYKVPFEDLPKNGQPSYKTGEGFMGILRELYGAWGLVRRSRDTQFRIINFPSPVY